MCGDMVRATLNDTKTQTRRIAIRNPLVDKYYEFTEFKDGRALFVLKRKSREFPLLIPVIGIKPKCQVGGRFWVKETFRTLYDPATCLDGALDIDYRADGKTRIGDKIGTLHWKPSIFMPRWASRIKLEVTEVRVHRVEDISEDDSFSEGVGHLPGFSSKDLFRRLWDELNFKRGYGWKVNPNVFAYTFKRISP